MTFSLDRTRSFLKIEEPFLLEFHRSLHAIVPSPDYCLGHLCDAFICVVHEYNLHRVYIALHDQLLKSNLVFTADPIKPDKEKIAALTLEARQFLENIGFAMNRVDINFSTAIREVIIKGTSVMREPSLALQLDAVKTALEVMTAGKAEATLKASRELMGLKGELEGLRIRLTAATAAQQASAVQLAAAVESRAGSDRPAGPDASQESQEVAGVEAEGLRFHNAEKELRQLREELGAVKTALEVAMESLKQAKDEARLARKEQQRYQHDNEALSEKLHSGQLELEESRNEIEGVRRELHEAGKRHESALQEWEARTAATEADHQAETAALKAELADLKSEAADLKAEINRLAVELAGNDVTNSCETELLRVALAEANVSLSFEKAKNESALQEMDALERNASFELNLLKKKVETLSAEKQLLEKVAAEIKIKASGEIERQQQINQSQRKAAIKKLNALKEEIRQLAEARAVIASPTGMPLIQSAKIMPAPAADERKEISFAGQQTGFDSAAFGSCEVTDFVSFLPDNSLKGIPYSLTTDVVEVYRSYNSIQAAPYGKRSQKCDGFVCLVSEGGRNRVYVAWLLNSNGETLICVPDSVDNAGDSWQSILREGISYFEKIGFLIDRIGLEQDPDKRRRQLDGLEIFRRNVTECAA